MKSTVEMSKNSIYLDKKKILIVDDDEYILEATKTIFELEGYIVETHTQGDVIYDLEHSEELPDLIFLDILLSGEDGKVLCQFLKTQEKTKHIPIIVFSAHSKGNLKTLFQYCTPDYFLPKPFDVNTVLNIVKNLLEK